MRLAILLITLLILRLLLRLFRRRRRLRDARRKLRGEHLDRLDQRLDATHRALRHSIDQPTFKS